MDEAVDFVFGNVLHDDDVCQLSAEFLIISLREVVFRANLRRWTFEEDGIAVLVLPAGPADFLQFVLEVCCAIEHVCRLLCPFVVTDGLDEPPELERLDGIAGAVNHLHILVEIGDVVVVLIIVNVTCTEE